MKPTNKFGWCLDHNDENCREEYVDWMGRYKRCGCDCHPTVTEEHIAAYVEAHPVASVHMPEDTKRARRSKVPVARPARSVRVAEDLPRSPAPKRNLAAEKKAAALVEAALTAVESNEDVVARMNEEMS